MSESDKPQLRQITREDIEFLAALQDEMNTQPHQCQADPRFWVVMTHEYREAREGIDQVDRVTLLDDNFEELESMTPDEAVLAALKAGTKGEEWMGSWQYIERWCRDTGKHAFFETKAERIAENTMFLTLREAKEHIKRNDYHYIDPHTYGMTAWRSPQVEQLYKILHEVDFKQLLEVASDED